MLGVGMAANAATPPRNHGGKAPPLLPCYLGTVRGIARGRGIAMHTPRTSQKIPPPPP